MAGDRNERHFVRIFNDTDHWKAQRAAASGRGTDADLPDVTFAQDGLAFAGELKSDGNRYLRIDQEKMEGLRAYAEAYGMIPVAIHRPNGDRSFYVFNPDDMDRTDSGNYRGDPQGDRWAARIAEPEGAADGIYPEDLTAFHLRHALLGELGKGITEPPAGREGTPLEPEVDGDG